MNNRLYLFLLLAVALTACSKTPSWVIPEKEMEQLLFDMHLAEAEIDNDYSEFNDSIRRSRLFEAVFQKHGVDRASFDTSLVWYAGHLDLYIAMYDRIAARYTTLNDTLNARLQVLNELEAKAKKLWAQDSLFILWPLAGDNAFYFQLDTSSYFAAGDMYELHLFALGVSDSLRPKITLHWEGQDTSLVKRDVIRQNGFYSLYLKAIPGKVTKSVSGTIRIPTGKQGQKLIVDDLYLYKYKEGSHPEIKGPEPQAADSLVTDSASAAIANMPKVDLKMRPGRPIPKK